MTAVGQITAYLSWAPGEDYVGQCLQSTCQPCLPHSEGSVNVPVFTATVILALTVQGSLRWGWTEDELGVGYGNGKAEMKDDECFT